MFLVKLYDIKGQELQLGDIVKISTGRNIHFYCEIKFIKDGILAPFHTFSFLSIEKAQLPANAIKSKEERYSLWYTPNEDGEIISNEYLLEWRQCEALIKMWKIYDQTEQLIGLLEWMNKVSSKEPMRLETDFDDIVQQYLNEKHK